MVRNAEACERKSFKHKGSYFLKRNRLLDRKGMPYRKKDLKRRGKVGSKRNKVVEKSEQVVSGPQEPDTKESYSKLLDSMKKKPKVYFEQIINQLGEEEEEDEEEEENEEDDDDSETGEETEDESDDETENLRTFQHNFGSLYIPCVQEVPVIYENVPHPLYNIKVSTTTQMSKITFTELKTIQDLISLDIEPSLARQWEKITKQVHTKGLLKPVSNMLLPALQSGRDILFSDFNFDNQQEILKVLSIHSLNHVMKTRKLILKNNNRLLKSAQSISEIDIELCRDQGFTRPKVLVLLPFRNIAHKFVKQLIKLALSGEKRQVSNKKRFDDEYGPGSDEKPSLNKSLSYQKMFTGNNDDCFTLGIALAKNSVKIYTDFYKSDIIIASPLGLRTVIGGQGDKERDFDFLSSIEIMTLVMGDVFLMQNWDHLLHIYKHLHLTPSTDHDTDFSRVKMWYLDGLSSKYRQNILLNFFNTPETNSILNKECKSWRGSVRISQAVQGGVLGSVVVPIRQMFKKMPDKDPSDDHIEYLTTGRYQYFLRSVLPQYQTSEVQNIVIVIPSYFDFVRLRNNFKKEGWNFSQLSEYSSNKYISNVRRRFGEGEVKYLLTTERYFFFKRYKLKGVHHVIFYAPPLYPECYSHYLNMISAEDGTSILIYNKYDGTRLERLLGSVQCGVMMSSHLTTHIIISE